MPQVNPVSRKLRGLVIAAAALVGFNVGNAEDIKSSDGYRELLSLFADWREFERPPMLDGAPDYTAERFAAAHAQLKDYQARLYAIDPRDWPIAQQVDWHLVRAEMNGFDFNFRVLRPSVRDPAFYESVWTFESDTPAHEGPIHHAILELWTYEFPLSAAKEARLIADLQTIPPLLKQARGNLTGNARDLWVAGIKNIRNQHDNLDTIVELAGDSASNELTKAISAAKTATSSFADWLEEQAPSKTGPSGIGIDDYTWQLRNVHYVPLTWEEEVTLLRRELDRAWASLRLEEHRNRNLPPLVSIESEEEYDRRANESVTKYIRWLDEQDILPVPEYYDQALRERIGTFVPKETRNFFWTAVHFEPTTLWTHFYHYFDLAQIKEEPHESPVRRGALLYNIWDSRAEGMATGVEEMMLLSGLYDDNPHVREIVYVMLAQRAARGLGSLYAHANDFSMQEAAEFHVSWTPRGWMRKDLDLLAFEQHLYMRQPGYGSSYVTGKYLIEKLLAERSKQIGDTDFRLYDFYDEVNKVGVIPVSLIRWQLTGNDDEIRALCPECFDER
ncbi:MAG: DUF885 domain-containing protein [Gammaproteobacteria bacterium]|nr:DUF885 domain-containing protein [Gammaproteobacteria bacterium]